MSDFINTVDVIGADVLIDSIIDRSVTEIVDDMITIVGQSAFGNCTKLEKVDLPISTEVGRSSFENCSSLKTANIPNATSMGGYTFSGCKIMAEANLPLVDKIPDRGFQWCENLKKLRFGRLRYIKTYGLTGTKSLTALILSNEDTVCGLSGTHSVYGGISSGTCYIYVPRALLDDYKTATNWSNYADQFQALEDFTDDGTLDGKFVAYTISNELVNVHVTNKYRYLGPRSSYTTTLYTATGDDVEIEEVSVTMGGIDITADVYNAETGQIDIPLVTGDLVIKARADTETAILTPYDGSEEGELPLFRMDVSAGQVISLTFYLTKQQGYLYDGRECGSGYALNPKANTELTTKVTIAKTGYITFSCYHKDTTANGQLAAGDRLYGKYLKIKIVEG